jgi:tol-pal system protein YbgF
MIRRLSFCAMVTTLTLAPAFAVDKNMLELQREVGLLEEAVKQLQQSQDKQLAALQTLVQQSLTASNQASRDVAVIQSNFAQTGNQLKDQVVAPVVGLNTRMDQVSNDVRTLQQAMADLTSSISQIKSQLSDVSNAVKVLSTPPPPPPTATMPGTTGASALPGSSPFGGAPAPPMNQTDLFNAAQADYNTGKLDLAMQEFQDFLKYFGNSDMAPNAQYWIGQIDYSNKNYDAAVQAFDMVVEKYPDSSKVRDAKYYKGMSLVAQHKLTDAHKVFQDMEKSYSGTESANKACTEDKVIGFNCYKAAAGATRRKRP